MHFGNTSCNFGLCIQLKVSLVHLHPWSLVHTILFGTTNYFRIGFGTFPWSPWYLSILPPRANFGMVSTYGSLLCLGSIPPIIAFSRTTLASPWSLVHTILFGTFNDSRAVLGTFPWSLWYLQVLPPTIFGIASSQLWYVYFVLEVPEYLDIQDGTALVVPSDGGKSQPSFSALIKVFVYILYRCLRNNADYMQHKGLLIRGVGTRFP